MAILEAHRLQTVQCNVRFRGGELDLVLRDGPDWVFFEARARADDRFAGAAASVGSIKQRQRIRAA